MMHVSPHKAFRHPSLMTMEDDLLKQEAKLWGAALRVLRLKAGLTQEEAGDLVDRSHQVWAYWENGARVKSFLKEDVQRHAAEKLGFTWDQLSNIKESLARGEATLPPEPHTAAGAVWRIPVTGDMRHGDKGFGVYEGDAQKPLEWERYIDENTRVLPVADNSAFPFADAGGFVTYSIKAVTRPGQGVVVKLRNGPYIVRKYTRQLAGELELIRYETVRIGDDIAHIERTERLTLNEIEHVYPVALRCDVMM